MNTEKLSPSLPVLMLLSALLATCGRANPLGGTVVQGQANITSQGNQLTIQQSSATAQINWSSFNIGQFETTTFAQPSSSSVTWNWINEANGVSSIDGHLNANGYVVLQNPAGFTIGGNAVLSAHGLVLTTSRMAVPDLSSPSAWQFNALPPAASIVNYGQLRTDGANGGSIFLIAADVKNAVDSQNNSVGTISAPQGNIALCAGQEVLVSTRPDGRGLSARVTMPAGSVDNQGQLIADAGTIMVRAQTVNQGGLVQANSVRNINGVIELVASDGQTPANDSLTLGPNSVISAQGDDTSGSASQGGFVVVKSDSQFTDNSTSAINVSGKAGGRNGVVEIFGNASAGSPVTPSTINSQIDGQSASAFLAAGGLLYVNPKSLTLSSDASNPSAKAPVLGLRDLSSFSKIDLFTPGILNLAANWSLADSQDPDAMLSLSAGNKITLNASLSAGNNWAVTMSAGPANLTAKPAAGDGIYVNGDNYIQTQNGSIDLWAANEVIVNPALSQYNGVRTTGGGSINVVAQYGDVNTGGNYNGFDFGQRYVGDTSDYQVAQYLGGISTAAGGDVTITAGGNVTSYLPVHTPGQSDDAYAEHDGGAGAFGAQPGNVTIRAGGNVCGHYVLANGVGAITADRNVGAPITASGFALSLIKGSWSVQAPSGSIYVQDIRNPNGVFNGLGSVAQYAAYHRFDYDPLASVLLDAGCGVEITGLGVPHTVGGSTVPIIFPPSLTVNAGAGGFVLDTDVILFPSPNGELNITTTRGGDFKSYEDPVTHEVPKVCTLAMSDSAATQWDPRAAVATFGLNDHASIPPELNNPNPVRLSIAGSIENVNLRTTKATEITVGGDTCNFGFLGQNLHAGDVTSINVAGSVSYPPVYSFVTLASGEPIRSPEPVLSPYWDAIFSLLLDPSASLKLTAAQVTMTPQQLTRWVFSADSHLRLALKSSGILDTGYSPNNNPGFIYDPATRQLGFKYQMSQAVFNALNRTAIPILKLDSQGNVVIERHADGNYYFATTTASFIAPAELAQLYNPPTQPVKDQQHLSPGFQLGGPGCFNINVTGGSLDLGGSGGIISWGIGSDYNPINYQSLAPWTPAGAAVKVTVAGDISLLTSTIASIDGGDVTVDSEQGGIYLSQGSFSLIPPGANIAYGIWTSGHSDVQVTAEQDINVGGARIATFNGGDVTVHSDNGDVNAGNGANSLLLVPVVRWDPATRRWVSDTIQNPRPFGSGILAISPTAQYQAPGANGLPGDITVETPCGDIVSTLGGIQQFALNGSIAGGPRITLSAGTKPTEDSPGFAGDVDLGQGGVIGGSINITAEGSVNGLIVSRQDANINSAQSFSGTLLSGGTANVSASAGGISGTIIGISGVNASGGGGVSANVMGQNVSIGGAAAQSTLGTTAAATSTSQAAAQQATTDAKQQLAKDATQDDDQKKKRNGKSPVLTRHVGRVTVLLPGS